MAETIKVSISLNFQLHAENNFCLDLMNYEKQSY